MRFAFHPWMVVKGAEGSVAAFSVDAGKERLEEVEMEQ
jgi:hypothetical protein